MPAAASCSLCNGDRVGETKTQTQAHMGRAEAGGKVGYFFLASLAWSELLGKWGWTALDAAVGCLKSCFSYSQLFSVKHLISKEAVQKSTGTFDTISDWC